MSGIEVAGIVLGVFPILIHALDKYRDGADEWWKIQRAYTQCKHDLDYHRILFEDNIERFLVPLTESENQLNKLMADPAGDGWEDKELEDRLRERLPKSYNVFLKIMMDINEVMEMLRKELGAYNLKFEARINKDCKLVKQSFSRKDFLNLSSFEFQAKRVKFSLRNKRRQSLFSKLQDANDRMRKLLDSNDQIVAIRASRSSGKIPPITNGKMNEYWRHAKRLHQALMKPWQCDCTSHVASLQLDHRISNKIDFGVLFDLRVTQGNPCRRSTHIEMTPDPNRSITSASVNVQQLLSSVPQAARRVRFAPPHDQTSTPSNNNQIGPIADLCSALSTNPPDYFGYLDEDGHRFVVHPATQGAAMVTGSMMSLSRLLDGAHTFTRLKRYCLAYTIACWFLRLGSTPWLSLPLKDSIVFFEDLSCRGAVALEEPYIRHELCRNPSVSVTGTTSSLGICLLELCFGTPLENNAFRKQLPVGDDAMSEQMLDLAAALQWSKEVGQEAGPDFAEAIDWCLRPRDLNEEGWRKEFWSRVVVPLDACQKPPI